MKKEDIHDEIITLLSSGRFTEKEQVDYHPDNWKAKELVNYRAAYQTLLEKFQKRADEVPS
jgi:hypothetical protein